ncbi:MAG: PKD domain-containing protein [Phycisphaerae bacterium]|nr:PKD domain-containing protein [Phycisphaerae bacterium]
MRLAFNSDNALRKFSALALLLTAVCGCPPAPSTGDSAVTAVADASIRSGAAPLTVAFSASGSTSRNAGPLAFVWSFDDGTTATGEQVSHTFTAPGLYEVRVTVTDSADASATGSVDIRAAGVGATAIIESDVNSGPAPLLVRFDGTSSSAPDDEIRDYFWDFGDGNTDRDPSPSHQYTRPGEYTASLRVVTGGGVENIVTTTIRVDASSASLQFASGDRATLPLTDLGGTSQTLDALTLEFWCRTNVAGGTLLNLGDNSLIVSVNPGANRVILTIAGVSTTIDATNLADRWRHLAITFNADDIGAGVYLDGALIGTAPPIPGNLGLSVTRLLLGNGFVGNLADIRLWSSTRTVAQISSNYEQRLTGTEPGLIRYWPADDASTQFINELVGGDAGVRGTNSGAEAADAEWSTDSPPVDD